MKSTWRGYKKRRKLSSHEHDKNRTVQHKKRKETFPKISSPAKKNTSDAEFSDNPSPIEKEKGVSDRKNEQNEKMMRENRQNAQMTLPLLIWRKV